VIRYIESIKSSTYMFWLMLVQLFSTISYGMHPEGKHTFTLEHEDLVSILLIVGFFIVRAIEDNRTRIDIYEKGDR